MTHSSWLKLLGRAALLCFTLGNNVHAAAVNPENQTMQFSYTTNGAADGSINIYGNNAISVSGDVLTVEIGDSDNNRNVSGVGIYELKLSNQSLEDARNLADLLCSPKDPGSDVAIPDLYTAKCNGETRSSYVRDFSRDIARKIHALMNKLKDTGIQDGKKVVKLDLSLVSIDREKDGFLVSFRFSNSGDYPIRFKTPDRWDSKIGRNRGILGVNGYRVGGSDDDQFGLALAGRLLVDPQKSLADGEINLAPHSFVLLKMKTNSIEKFSAGTYDLNIGAFMNMEVIGIQSNLLRVDFHSDYKNPTRVTFDRDYPSTPEEREQWEAIHRQEMSWHPVKPGQTFAEAGLYRAVRTSGAYRGLLLKPFKAGDVATTEPVTMPMDSEYAAGTNISGPVHWLWEASAPTPVKQWSFDIIEDTAQFCEPGVACPRSGRWVPRVMTGSGFGLEEYQYRLAGIVTLHRGETMPSIEGNSPKWEWVGVSNG